MKIVSWNILQGGGRRMDDVLGALSGWAPDIVALQEVRPRTADVITDHLAKMGLGSCYVSDHATQTENCLLIAARDPVEAGDFMQDRQGLCHLIEAEVAGLTILAAHFPQKAAQVPLFEALLADTPSLLGYQTLLIGDLNCGIPFEDSTAKTFSNTKRFQACLEAGWIDAYRRLHGKEARDFSWVSPRTGRGFRYDHALASPTVAQRIKSLHYDHSVRERGLSDHSALILKLGDSP